MVMRHFLHAPPPLTPPSRAKRSEGKSNLSTLFDNPNARLRANSLRGAMTC